MQVHKRDFVYGSSWFQLIRPMTLTGTITPILAGSALAASQSPIHLDRFIVMMVAALLVQVTANILNDYFDFKNGQDQEKWVHHHATEGYQGLSHAFIPILAVLMISVAVILGVWLVLNSTVWVGVAGAVSIFAGYKYSAGPRSFSAIGLGELVAAIFLGIVVTTLSYVIQGHEIGVRIFCVSLPYGFLIASMILANNIRDIEKDRPFRKTLAHALGRKRAVQLLFAILACAYLSAVSLLFVHVVSWSVLGIIIAIPLAFSLLHAFRADSTRTDEIEGMKWAAWHHWVFGLPLALSIWFSHL